MTSTDLLWRIGTIGVSLLLIVAGWYIMARRARCECPRCRAERLRGMR